MRYTFLYAARHDSGSRQEASLRARPLCRRPRGARTRRRGLREYLESLVAISPCDVTAMGITSGAARFRGIPVPDLCRQDRAERAWSATTRRTETTMAQQSPQTPAPPQSRVLLVEDDALVADVTQARLTRLGYEVVTVLDPREGLQRFTADPQGFTLLLTNRDMPGMSGLELAAACRLQRPDLPIILCTGGAPLGEPGALIDAVLRKPYQQDELAAMLEQVLHTRRTG
jgi:CheY-like chemotaxis protein